MQHTTSAGLKCGSVSRNLLTTIAYCLRTSSRSPSLLSHAYRRGISQPAPRLGRSKSSLGMRSLPRLTPGKITA